MERILDVWESGQAVLVASRDEISSLIEDVSIRFPKLKVLGFFLADYELDYPLIIGATSLGVLHDVSRFLNENIEVTHVICSFDNIVSSELLKLSLHCEKTGRRFLLISSKLSEFHRVLKLDYAGATVLVSSKKCPMASYVNRFVKRLVDLLLSLLILLTVFPIVYVYKAIRIKCGMGGPVFATVVRYNVVGMPLSLFCFRKKDGEKDKKIDRLPFLLSVFVGNLSLVGPPALSQNENEEYMQLLQKYHLRFSPKSGLISNFGCLSGENKSKSQDVMAEQVRTDAWYVEHWTLWHDLRFVLRFVFRMFN